MRAFAIADASKRKAKPIGVLLWEPDEDNKQGAFSLELSSSCDETLIPLSLSFCTRRKGRRATPEESKRWVESRIVPENRHNITEVLMANGLSEYDEVGLLAACMGRSSDDDCLVYEIDVANLQIAALDTEDAESFPLNSCGITRVDRILSSITQRHGTSEVRYAFVNLDGPPRASAPGKQGEKPTSAQRIGATIRSRRLDSGLTQKQLAVQAGITQTVLSRVESGKGNPTLELLESIAAALGVELDISLRQEV